MSENRAAEDLAAIREMMARTSTYHRSMAPPLLASGAMGVSTAVVGVFAELRLTLYFAAYWQGVALVTLAASLLLVWRQARAKGEAMWSPPARQMARALLAPFLCGLVFGVSSALRPGGAAAAWSLVPLWLLFYGCGVQAASAALPGGLRGMGWRFIVLGAALLFALPQLAERPSLAWAHAAMGVSFGGLHLIFGLVILIKDKGRDAP